MVWVKLDDKFHANPKMLAAGNAARGLYAAALSFCGDQLTDGHVPLAWAKKAGSKAERDKLTAVGAWVPVVAGESVIVREKDRESSLVAPTTGFIIRDYLTLNPSRAKVDAERAKTAERQSKWRESNGVSNAVSHTVSNGRPDPAFKDQRPLRKREADQEQGDPRLKTHPFVCQICTVRVRFDFKLAEHFYTVHGLMQAPLEAAVLEAGLSLDCIPRDIPRSHGGSDA